MKLKPGAYFVEGHSSKYQSDRHLVFFKSDDTSHLEWSFYLLPNSFKAPWQKDGSTAAKNEKQGFLIRFVAEGTERPVSIEEFTLIDFCRSQVLFQKGLLEPAEIAKPTWNRGQVALFVPAGLYMMHATARGYVAEHSMVEVRYQPGYGGMDFVMDRAPSPRDRHQMGPPGFSLDLAGRTLGMGERPHRSLHGFTYTHDAFGKLG